MSQIEKVGRGKMFVKRNREILETVRKLLKEYEHNHTCAKNLFAKAQIDRREIPPGYEQGSYPSYNFTTEW